MKSTITGVFFIFAMLLNNIVQSAPSIKMCIEESCRKPHIISIKHKTWSEVKAIFAAPVNSDIDEQDNMTVSIRLIEDDVYSQLASLSQEHDDASSFYAANSEKLNYKNLRRIIGVLLDAHLVARHFLRHTLRSIHWRGEQIDGLVIQSLTDSGLYVIQKDTASLHAPLVVSNYADHTSTVKPATKVEMPDESVEDSFE